MTAPDAHNRSTPGNAPVTAPETDALDAWLESITSPRHGEWSRDISGRSRRAANGKVEPGTTLESVAKQFHEQLANAENRSGPDIPVDAIWEKIMASTTIAASAPPQPHVAGRAADLVSNGVARASRPTRTIPAWLAGSHWAVSAFMVAAVVVGIVALYGSFAGSPGSGDDPATNPNFAMGTPGGTESTPEPDIDRWLADPSTIDCERDPQGSVNSAEWATDRPSAVEDYVPFSPAASNEGRALADRWWYLNANCAPTADDPLITDDFGWMTTSPIGIPTADQIASAQEISAALPMQDYRSYYIVREPASAATPVAGAGSGNRLVLLPQDVIQLADGRVGGPLRIPIHTEDADKAISEFTGGLEAAATIFVVFEQVDGVWLLDEQFSVCVGECETVWADLATFENYPERLDEATPVADAAWLAPISPDECDVAKTRTLEEVGAIMQDPGQFVPREYSPVTEVEAPLTQDVAGANRAWESCRAQGLIGERRAVESLRYIAEIEPYNVVSPLNSASYDDWVALNETLRASFLDPDAESYLVETEALPPFDCDTGYGETDLPAQVSYEVIQPEDLVQLPDGRIGGPVTSLAGSGFLQCLETRPPAMSSGYQATYVHIFAQDPTREGRWALDERFRICVSGCDTYYEESGSDYLSYLYPPWPATPDIATPSATPDDAAWLAPIAPDECDVEARSLEDVAAFIEDPGETVPRDYAIVGPAEPATAAEVSSADRVWRSCGMYEGAAERRAMESPRYIHQESPNALADVSPEEQQATYRAMRYLSEEVISQDYLDYRIDSDTFRQEIDAIMPGEITQSLDHLGSVIVPDQVVTFADGRLGGPVSIVRNPFPEGFDPQVDNDYWAIEFHIYSQDPARDGAWVLDQRLDLCIGECDVVWTAYELEYGPTPSSLATPIAATPALSSVASPAASTTTLQPISADECVVDPVSEDELSAIMQDPDGEVERSYAPTGPVDDALAQEVTRADRAWQSCFVFGSAGERAALQSPRLTRDGPGVQAGMGRDREDLVVELERFDASRGLGDMMLTGDWQDYYIESELFEEGSAGAVQVPDFIPTIPIPEQATLLADGRIAIPIVMLVPPGAYPLATEDVDDIPYLYIQVHILTEDPTRDGRWVMDEEIFLCTGDCDLARAQGVEYIDYVDSLVPNADEATPAATPQARRDGQAA